DLQINRMASLATDLNHFLFGSIDGFVRKPNIDQLLNDYYTSFSSVIEEYGEPLPFTKEELVQEYRKKNAYGLIVANNVIPAVTQEDVPDLESLDLGNPACKPRLVAMYDEMLEEGLFN
ncbi:unnamed protein product, partial [Meganyctiphanes norvegica]